MQTHSLSRDLGAACPETANDEECWYRHKADGDDGPAYTHGPIRVVVQVSALEQCDRLPLDRHEDDHSLKHIQTRHRDVMVVMTTVAMDQWFPCFGAHHHHRRRRNNNNYNNNNNNFKKNIIIRRILTTKTIGMIRSHVTRKNMFGFLPSIILTSLAKFLYPASNSNFTVYNK